MVTMDTPLLALPSLSQHQKSNLQTGKILSISDLLLVSSTQIAKQCKITLSEAQSIIDIVCKEHVPQPRSLVDVDPQDDDMFTTGDAELDNALGGGIRTGMIWEIAGESAAGKTQLGLQLSLTVQLPKDKGGASGSACYLTTSSKLPTTRLVEMIKAHPLLSPPLCSLSDVQTMQTPNIPLLLHVLSDLLPTLILKHSCLPYKPVKLLVIDALAELFHSNNKTTTQTLVERSRNICDISNLLHALASRYDIAILVLNEVSDAFNKGYSADTSTDLIYKEQSRWFSRADSVPGENCKEASLGLVWANQVNVRVMLSRTGRRRYLDEVKTCSNKIQKLGDRLGSDSHNEPAEESATLIRRLSVVFNAISHPVSLDYIVTIAGISILADPSISSESQQLLPGLQPASERNNLSISNSNNQQALLQVSPLDVGCSQDANLDGELVGEGQVDEWEAYWQQNDVPEDAYNSVDLSSCVKDSNT